MTLTTAERRRIVGLVVTIFVAALLRAAVPGYAAVRALAERVEGERALLAQLEAAIAGLPALEDSARTLRAGMVGLAPRLLAGDSEEVALADLSGRLTSVAARHHARLLKLEPLPDSAPSGRLRQIRVRAIFETDFKGVAELFAVFERQALLLVPEKVTLTQLEPPPTPEAPERLEVELALAGWYLPEDPR